MHRTLLTIAMLLTASSSASAAPIMGIAQAIDGDSLQVGNQQIRLFGVDAPEAEQNCKRGIQSWPCGEEAAAKLRQLVTGRDVFCIPVNIDQYDRAVARCRANGKDVNAAMVESGLATAYRRYSMDYVPFEDRAKAAKRGLWSGTFTPPSDYRHAQQGSEAVAPDRRTSRRRISAPAPAFRGGCVIKGNQGSNGWIYHLPGMPYYQQTRAEQMFCSEADAQAAGYRRAIVR